jgi:hypothetical protein
MAVGLWPEAADLGCFVVNAPLRKNVLNIGSLSKGLRHMREFEGLRLSAYYLNSRRLEAMTGAGIPVEAEESLIRNSSARVSAMRFAASVAHDVLMQSKIPNLNNVVAERDVESERVLAFVWGVFAFRGISVSLERERSGKQPGPGTFSGTIPLGDREYQLSGQLTNDHLYSETSNRLLTGRKRMLIAGQFEFDGSAVNVEPYIIGDMTESFGDGLRTSWSASVRVHPSQIDAFAKLGEEGPVSEADLQALLNISEEDVKHSIADIIGEPFVPKDWAGEKSDLQTNIDGQPHSAAFIFKGPSLPREMHPADMGKRGDQLVRIFDEPVELVVIQHCSKIANSVVRIALHENIMVAATVAIGAFVFRPRQLFGYDRLQSRPA